MSNLFPRADRHRAGVNGGGNGEPGSPEPVRTTAVASGGATGAPFDGEVVSPDGRMPSFAILADVGDGDGAYDVQIGDNVLSPQPEPIAFDQPDSAVTWTALFSSKVMNPDTAFTHMKGHNGIRMKASPGAFSNALGGGTTRVLLTHVSVVSATVTGAPPVPFKFSLQSGVNGGGGKVRQWFTEPSINACVPQNDALDATGAGVFVIGGERVVDQCAYRISHSIANDPWVRTWARVNTRKLTDLLARNADPHAGTVSLSGFGTSMKGFSPNDDAHAAASILLAHPGEEDAWSPDAITHRLGTESRLTFPYQSSLDIMADLGARLQSDNTELHIGKGSDISVTVQPAVDGGWSTVARAHEAGLSNAAGVLGGGAVSSSCTLEFHGVRLD